MANNIINSHRSIIFLNGTFPSKKIIKFINTNVPIIAADGASQKLFDFGLTPNYIIGDGDSYMPRPHNPEVEIMTILEQDSTDFEKCISFAKKANLFPSLICGVNGGEIDHIIGNTQAMLKSSEDCDLYFLDTYKKSQGNVGVKLGFVLTNKRLKINTKKGATVSIIPFQDAFIKTKGLCWELDGDRLHIDGILGLRNASASRFIEFDVRKGKVLVILDVSEYFEKNPIFSSITT